MLSSESGRPAFRREVRFQVVSPPTPTPEPTTPVREPSVRPLATTPVFWPDRDGSGLVQEWRPRTTAVAAVRTVVDGGTDNGDIETSAWRGSRVESVERTAGRIEIRLSGESAAAVEPGLAGRSLARTANGYFGTRLPVVVSLPSGRTLDVSPDARDASTQHDGPHFPLPDAVVDGPLTLVGVTRYGPEPVTWYVLDPVTQLPLYQGRAPVDQDQGTYAGSVDLPPGRYILMTEIRDGTYTSDVTVR